MTRLGEELGAEAVGRLWKAIPSLRPAGFTPACGSEVEGRSLSGIVTAGCKTRPFRFLPHAASFMLSEEFFRSLFGGGKALRWGRDASVEMTYFRGPEGTADPPRG